MSDADLDDLLRPPGGPRILFIDLERVPGSVTMDIWHPKDFARMSYGPHPSKWDEQPRMLCFAARWDGRKRGEFHASWDNDDPHHLARESWRLASEATHLVTYAGTIADVPWLKQSWLEAELPPPAPFKHIDLYKVAAQFGYPSRSLAHLCSILGLEGKQGHYSIADARACLAGDEKARRKMRRYNLGDVAQDTLGGVFERLRPWIRGLNLGALALTDEKRCPYCASENVRRNGWYTAAVQSYAQWTCDDCGGHSRSNIVKSRASLRGVS